MSQLTSSIAHLLSATAYGSNGRLLWTAENGLEVCVKGEFTQYPTVDLQGAKQIAWYVNFPLTII